MFIGVGGEVNTDKFFMWILRRRVILERAMERGRKMSSSSLIYFSNRNNWEMFKKPVESEARKGRIERAKLQKRLQ